MQCTLKLLKPSANGKGYFKCSQCDTTRELPVSLVKKGVGISCHRGPGLAARAGNFSNALAEHVAAGLTVVTDDVFNARSQKCHDCIKYFDGAKQICTHKNCGCGVAGAEKFADKRRWATSKCPIGRWNRPVWISNQQRVIDTRRLMEMLPGETSAIVGVARSGLAPATEIAMALHLPLYILSDSGSVILDAGMGYRLRGQSQRNGLVVAIDDSHATGRSYARGISILRNSKEFYDRDLKWGVVYTNPETEHQPDFAAVQCHGHHLFEWNFANSVYTPDTAWDIDGAIFSEPPRQSGRPYLLPRRTEIPLVVTGRLQSEYDATMQQFRHWGLKVKRLECFPGTDADRHQPMAISYHKAKHYEESSCQWFVESCPIQAKEIAGISGKCVICPVTGEVF